MTCSYTLLSLKLNETTPGEKDLAVTLDSSVKTIFLLAKWQSGDLHKMVGRIRKR